jgi:GDP-L-fucose synthase
MHTDKIMITGASGFLGKALHKELINNDYVNIIPLCSKDGNLVDYNTTEKLVMYHNPDVIIHLAAKVGGIGANMAKPGEFIYDNIAMGINLIEAARLSGVGKFVQIGTVCSYPKNTPVPFSESYLWNGFPEETNAPYGIAKKALLTMLQAYRQQYNFNGIYLIPVNLYGPGDNFNLNTSHVIPALIRKIAEAKQRGDGSVNVWGTGKASREFLYVEDCARAIRLATERYDRSEPVNIGTNEEITIEELAIYICDLMGYSPNGSLMWDNTKPDGQPRRCLNVDRAKTEFGFTPHYDMWHGLRNTIDWFYKEYPEYANAATHVGN